VLYATFDYVLFVEHTHAFSERHQRVMLDGCGGSTELDETALRELGYDAFDVADRRSSRVMWMGR
jgi:hypothetical protein